MSATAETSFRETIERHPGRLSEADHKLVQVLFRDADEAAFLSVDGLAARAGVSPATVTRLAQKLGYGGFPQLREALQGELIERTGPGERVRRRLAHADSGVLAAIVADEIEALVELPRRVDQDELDRAARALIGARRVFVFGRGHATALVDLADRRLRRAGFDAIALPHEGRELAERVLTLSGEDVVLAFALRQRPTGLEALMERARERGARVVAISDALGPLLRPQADVLLAAPRGPEGEFQSHTVPMAILNGLILTVARLDSGRSLAALDEVGELIESFEGTGRRPT